MSCVVCAAEARRNPVIAPDTAGPLRCPGKYLIIGFARCSLVNSVLAGASSDNLQFHTMYHQWKGYSRTPFAPNTKNLMSLKFWHERNEQAEGLSLRQMSASREWNPIRVHPQAPQLSAPIHGSFLNAIVPR